MLEALAKNLWLFLTLLMPGMCTYGAWRVLLLLDPPAHLSIDALNQIDESAIASASVIMAIALLQQAIAITIEAALAQLARIKKGKWPNYFALFIERFSLAASGRFDESVTRIVGNFFLSLNMCVGLSLLLVYFLAYEDKSISDWVPVGITLLLTAALLATAFRLQNAISAVKNAKRPQEKT